MWSLRYPFIAYSGSESVQSGRGDIFICPFSLVRTSETTTVVVEGELNHGLA